MRAEPLYAKFQVKTNNEIAFEETELLFSN